MIKLGPNYVKLKTKLNLACNRLKILQAKESEFICKQHREIEKFLTRDKYMQAKIKILAVLREEAFVEAMELIEIFCNELLLRFGFLKEAKEFDKRLEEAVSSLIWVAPLMESKVPELKDISKQLTAKFGRSYSNASRKNKKETVCPELIQRLQFEAEMYNFTSEGLRNILWKYDISEDKKAAFEKYFMKTGTVDSRDAILKVCSGMELGTSSTEVVEETSEGCVNKTEVFPMFNRKMLNDVKATNNPKKSFGNWLKKSICQSRSFKVPPEKSKGKDGVVSIENIPLPRNTHNENSKRKKYPDENDSVVDFLPYKNSFSEHSAQQNGYSEKNMMVAILNASAGKCSFSDARANSNVENENKDISNLSLSPGKCTFIGDINNYHEKKNEISPKRNKTVKAKSNFFCLPDGRTVNLNGVNFCYPKINGEITNITKDKEIKEIKEETTYTQCLKNYADDNQLIFGHSKMDEPPPPYYLFDVKRFFEVSSGSQFCNDGIEQNFYPPPLCLKSPSPSCPSDEMQSEEVGPSPSNMKSPSFVCPNNEMKSEGADSPPVYTKSPLFLNPYNELQSEKTSHTALYLKSPSPSCPSEEMQSEEVGPSPLNMKSPSFVCLNNEMKSEEAGPAPFYLQSPPPICPSDEMQLEEAEPPPLYLNSLSFVWPHDEMQSKDIGPPPLNMKSPSPSCPNDEAQSEKAEAPSLHLEAPSPSYPNDEM